MTRTERRKRLVLFALYICRKLFNRLIEKLYPKGSCLEVPEIFSECLTCMKQNHINTFAAVKVE